MTGPGRLLAAAMLLVAGGMVAGCESTGAARCDALVEAHRSIEAHGYRLSCVPPWPQPTYPNGALALGWTDHEHRTVWVWETVVTDGRVLAKVVWHELGHIVWGQLGLTGSQADEEAWADGYAWCHAPQPGVSYLAAPTDCTPWRAGDTITALVTARLQHDPPKHTFTP